MCCATDCESTAIGGAAATSGTECENIAVRIVTITTMSSRATINPIAARRMLPPFMAQPAPLPIASCPPNCQKRAIQWNLCGRSGTSARDELAQESLAGCDFAEGNKFVCFVRLFDGAGP